MPDRDQLAALFLKDRDVPCPVCQYNRRDGTQAACPECGFFLKLQPATPLGKDRPNRLLIALAVLMLVNGVMIVPGLIRSVYQAIDQGWATPLWLTSNICIAAGFVIAGVLSCIALAAMRNARRDPIRPMLLGGAAMLLLVLPQAVLLIAYMF